jgi:hypothetical protein
MEEMVSQRAFEGWLYGRRKYCAVGPINDRIFRSLRFPQSARLVRRRHGGRPAVIAAILFTRSTFRKSPLRWRFPAGDKQTISPLISQRQDVP